MSFSGWPIALKICAPVVVIAAFAAILAIVSLSSLSSAMHEERLAKIKDITQTAWANAVRFHNLEQSGALSRDKAQQRSLCGTSIDFPDRLRVA